jgi:hypothetical protein
VSNTNASRSLLPALPSVTSVTTNAQSPPRTFIIARNAAELRRTSWTATTSKRDTTSAIARTLLWSRIGLSPAFERQVGLNLSNARTFQVPMSRLVADFAGTVRSRAALIASSSVLTSAGGLAKSAAGIVGSSV